MTSSLSRRNKLPNFILGAAVPLDQSPEVLSSFRPRKPYVHARWAGGLSDLWKQGFLFTLVHKQENGIGEWTYFESHAGAGLHLVRPYAAWKEGIGALINRSPQSEIGKVLVEKAKPYIEQRGWYPGSWHLVATTLQNRRGTTQFLLWERDPLVYEDACRVAASLEKDSRNQELRIRLMRADGFEAIFDQSSALGAELVFIDPPYIFDGRGQEGDWDLVARAMTQLAQAGIAALAWYPLFGENRAQELVDRSECKGFELRLGEVWRGKERVVQGCGLLMTPKAAQVFDDKDYQELQQFAEDLGGQMQIRDHSPKEMAPT